MFKQLISVLADAGVLSENARELSRRGTDGSFGVSFVEDVFISYAREDREFAQRLAETLSHQGWVIWWDRKIIPGNKFDEVIEQHLETAKSVVVLWSEVSVRSEWVKNEAAVAAERGVLVPALIDHARLPLEFRRKQTANLMDWRGDASHPEFAALCEGIAETLGEWSPCQNTKSKPQKPHQNRLLTLMVTGTVAVVILIAAYVIIQWLTPVPIPTSECPEITVWDYSKVPPASHKEKRCRP